ASAAPVLTGTTVTSVQAAGGGYVVRTDRGIWRAPAVVLACGAATVPAVPTLARLAPAGITSVTPAGYRNPGELPRAGVLVVGAAGGTGDLDAWSWGGMRLAGRPAAIADGVAQSSGSLPNACALADLKLGRLLTTIDTWAGADGERFAPTAVRDARLGLDLR